MNKSTTTKKQEKRFKEAEQNYEELIRILTPFIKPRKVINISTQGQWQKAPDEGFINSNEREFDRKITSNNINGIWN
jgi:hypothetical protein